jgi:hypothetical protein
MSEKIGEEPKYRVGDFVNFDLDGTIKGSGRILGLAMRNIINTYIVFLFTKIEGYEDEAILVPGCSILGRIN